MDASLTLELAPGIYGVESVEYVPDEETSLLLHRLTLRPTDLPRDHNSELAYAANRR